MSQELVEIEKAVLGAVLLDPQCLDRVVDVVGVDCFVDDRHGALWSVLLRLFEAGDPIDLLSVTESARQGRVLEAAGGVVYISALTNRVSSSANVEHHARILAEKYLLRKTVDITRFAAVKAADESSDPFELIERVVGQLDGLIEDNTKHRAMRYADYEERQLRELDRDGDEVCSTGFETLDAVVGGWRMGDLHIVAGRPGMGKTSWATASCDECASRGIPVVLFSMEVSEKTMQARLASRRCGIPLANMLLNKMSVEDIQSRHAGLAASKTLPLYIRYDTGMSVAEIMAEVKHLKRTKGVKVVYIDQLNWIKASRGGNRDTEVGSITRGLKQMAMKLNVAVVLLHQLSREVERRGGDKKPQLSDLRDSGNVEQDAQVVVFVYRPEYYGMMDDNNGSTRDIIYSNIAKNSNGSLGSVRMHFDSPSATVRDLSTGSYSYSDTGRKPYKDEDDVF